MTHTLPGIAAEATPAAYGAAYYAEHYTSGYEAARDTAHAQAMADAAGLKPGDPVLDFGCGTGALTAAFNELGYPTVGVDFSADAINNAVPEARGRVHLLGGRKGLSLSEIPNDAVKLVVARDVFEHIPERQLSEIVEEQLQCIGRRVLAIIPITDENGDFVCKVYERDRTHVTRFPAELWLGFFSSATALDLTELTPHIRPSRRQVNGTMSLLLGEDPEKRQKFMRERALRPTIFGPRRRKFVDFDSLLSGAQR